MSYYSLLCRLEPLPEIGQKPPLSHTEALSIIGRYHEDATQVAALILRQTDHLGQSDRAWEQYFQELDQLGGECSCTFAGQLVAYEASLRRTLRGQRQSEKWSTTPDPLGDWKSVETQRWIWLKEHSCPYQFNLEETAAYAQGLVILERTWRWWHR